MAAARGGVEDSPATSPNGPEVAAPGPTAAAAPADGGARLLLSIAVLAAVYYVAGRLSLRLAFVHEGATAVWAPTGLALAALLLFGHRLWPGILIGAFLVNVTTLDAVGASAGIAIGNTLEALLGAWLVNRVAGGSRAFERARDTVRFFLFAGLLAPTVSAGIGVTTLCLAGLAAWSEYGAIWLTWWLGDATSVAVLAPVLLLWAQWRPRGWRGRRFLEVLALQACVLAVGAMVFWGLLDPDRRPELSFLCAPLPIWAAFRLGRRGAATSALLLSAVALGGTLRGWGPFGDQPPETSLLLLQAFMGLLTMTSTAVAVVVSERSRGEERVRGLNLELAAELERQRQLREEIMRDPLTGCHNRRYLEEFERGARDGWACILLDVDHLKRTNDIYGHQRGDEALVRLGRFLLTQIRYRETVVRLGGDEFLLLLSPLNSVETADLAVLLQREARERSGLPAFSLGWAVREPGERLAATIARADRLLVEARLGARR